MQLNRKNGNVKNKYLKYNLYFIIMQNIDYDTILDRKIYKDEIIQFLENFEKNKNQLNEKRGIYLSGDPGIGKTQFICNLLKDNGYDVIYYDSSDMRNKNIMELITNHNMSNINVYTMFTRERKKIVVVMDDIDGMNNGDKGGINSLIKIIRPKKTKKQKLEELSMNPIICIGNNQIDKKIRELVSQCKSINLNTPTPKQIANILEQSIDSKIYNIEKILDFIGNDLRKVALINNATKDKKISFDTLNSLFSKNFLIDDIKLNVRDMLNSKQTFESHNNINETDRTIVGLLWHENVIDVFNNANKENIEKYLKILKNICFADYIDRITFQKQIWEFNEMSSIIKTLYNNKLLFDEENDKNNPINDVRFTKVLTKYSTEYNNMVFVNNMCENLQMDKNDLSVFFMKLKNEKSIQEIIEMLEPYNISKLDILRIFKYLNIIKYGNQQEEVQF